MQTDAAGALELDPINSAWTKLLLRIFFFLATRSG